MGKEAGGIQSIAMLRFVYTLKLACLAYTVLVPKVVRYLPIFTVMYSARILARPELGKVGAEFLAYFTSSSFRVSRRVKANVPSEPAAKDYLRCSLLPQDEKTRARGTLLELL